MKKKSNLWLVIFALAVVMAIILNECTYEPLTTPTQKLITSLSASKSSTSSLMKTSSHTKKYTKRKNYTK